MLRGIVGTTLGFGIGAFLWRVRFLQVATFLSAAGLRRWLHSPNSRGPGRRAAGWSGVGPPRLSTFALNPNAMITYHPEYHNFDPELVISSLMACLQLRVGWLRTDVRWNELLPDGIHPDPQAVAWYRNFLKSAADCGLRNMVVLSTPPAAVLSQKGPGRLEAWGRFVEYVVSELGTSCSGYQLMNEPNGPIYGFLSQQDSAAAIVAGASIVHKADSAACVAINVSMDIWGWRQYLADTLHASGSAVDLIGLDHYPGTWTLGRGDRWAAVSEISEMIASAAPGTPWCGRRLAIMETGYSTNAFRRDDREQALYFSGVQDVIKRLNSKSPQNPTLCGIYELCDGDSEAWLDPEAHFGIMTSNLKPKASFAAVGQLVEGL